MTTMTIPCTNFLTLFVKEEVEFTPILKLFQISREQNIMSVIPYSYVNQIY